MLITVTERYKTDKLPQDTLTPPPKLEFLKERVFWIVLIASRKSSVFSESVLYFTAYLGGSSRRGIVFLRGKFN